MPRLIARLLALYLIAVPTTSCRTEKSRDLFIWTEWPGIGDASSATAFYEQLFRFVQKNCLGASVSRLILRVLHPEFGAQIWWPPSQSPMYTALIKNLPAGSELVLYPYFMDENSGASWMRFGAGSSDPVTGSWEFMKQWNDFLGSVGSNIRFIGSVVDMEEIPGLKTYSSVSVSPTLAADLKSKFGDLEFGVSIGFDTSLLAGYDKLYIQLYDFYSPKPFAASGLDSPFLLNKNDSSAIVDYLLNQAVTLKQVEGYAANSARVMAMWSIQNKDGNCLYPQNGQCGLNNEFGSWTSDAFADFLDQLTAKSPGFASIKHGIFQFSFTPTEWVA